MRIYLLVFAMALSLQGFCASMEPAGHHKNPFKEKQLYNKGKGTIGLVAGLAFGPIGYVGAHLFSRNRTVREKAGKGFAVWLIAIGLTVLVVAAVNSKQSGGQLALQILQGLLQNWN